MTSRFRSAAELPPAGLEGLRAEWSRLVTDENGATWHVLDNGVDDAERTLLCVHGNPSWSYLWRRLIDAAPPRTRVIAVDQLEMGFSERTGERRGLPRRIDDLCALTDALDLDGPVVTVAHDWGGPVSVGWALRHRDQLEGIVLLNTAVHQPVDAAPPQIIRLVRSRRLLHRATVTTAAFIRGAIRMSHPPLAEGVVAGLLAPYRTAGRREAIEDFVADIPLEDDHPSGPELDAIAAGLSDLTETPALLLWGARDPVFSDRYLHDLEQRLPHASVHRFATAGHFVSEDVDVIGPILAWLAHIEVDGAPDGADSVVEDDAGSARLWSGLPAELRARVESTAAGMGRHGIRPGQRVALMVTPGDDLTVALYACWRLGAVAVLVDAGLGPRGMSRAIAAAAPDHLIGIDRALVAARTLRWPGERISVGASPSRRRMLGATADLHDLGRGVAQVPPVPPADASAAVVFTSGATGPSKGVRYRHHQIEAQRDVLAELYGIGPDDRLVAAFAPFALFGPALGIDSVVPDMDVAAPATLTAAALGDSVCELAATLVFASPAALANVVATAEDLTDEHRSAFARVRLLLSAGAPVRASLLRDAAALFPNAEAHTPYGMTECLPVADITLTGIDLAGHGDGVCVGAPVPGVDVRIDPLDERGHTVGSLTTEPATLGEVVVQARHQRDGYDRLWFTDHLASNPTGWHRTGDVGSIDASGRLWIGGRIGHVLTTASGPVAPVESEQQIEALRFVEAAALVGVGPPGTQQAVAVIQPVDPIRRPRHASLELIDRIRAVVAVPVAAVLEVPALPVDRRHNSKVDRSHLAAWAADVLAGARLRQP